MIDPQIHSHMRVNVDKFVTIKKYKKINVANKYWAS